MKNNEEKKSEVTVMCPHCKELNPPLLYRPIKRSHLLRYDPIKEMYVIAPRPKEQDTERLECALCGTELAISGDLGHLIDNLMLELTSLVC